MGASLIATMSDVDISLNDRKDLVGRAVGKPGLYTSRGTGGHLLYSGEFPSDAGDVSR